MITTGSVLYDHDVSPVEILPPESFQNIDLYPAVAFTASRRKVATFGQVVERDDEHGVCLVSHFEVAGTLVVLYQSALDSKDHWTVFTDMRGCIDKQQTPTKLGQSVTQYLSKGSIQPDWSNAAADTVYRSARRKLSKPESHIVKSSSKAKSKSLLSASNTLLQYRDLLANFPAVAKKVSAADSMRRSRLKKAETSRPYAEKKAAVAAPKTAAAKRTTAAPKVFSAKKAAVPLRTASKKVVASKK